MALSLGELVAVISADDSRFRKTLASVKQGLDGVGKFAGFAALAGSATTFAVALAPALGVLAAAPAALAAVKLATITLSMALDGLGDALGNAVAGDAKKFQESLKELPPAMRSVAGELGAAAFGLKNNVQQAFFTPIKDQAKGLGKDLRGPLHASMVTVAAALGRVGARLTGVVREGKSLTFLKNLGRGTAAAIDGIGKGVPAVLRGVRDLAAVFVGDLGRAGASLGGLLARFGAWMSRIAKGGQATAWVRDALALFQQLGRIAANLGVVLVAVFGAAGTGAGDLLGSLEQLTARMAAWAESVQGQQTLANLFNLLNQTAADLMVVLPVLGGGLALIADLIASMPPGLQSVVTQGLAFSLVASLLTKKLGPLFAGLGKVAAGIGRVAGALRDSDSGVRRFASRLGGAAASAGRWAGRMAAAAGRAAVASARMAAAAAASAARVVAGWVVMAAQAMARAVVMAAAWLVAMGPVGLIIAAVIGLAALIFANWDNVKKWTAAAWAWVWDKIKAVTGFLTNLFLNWHPVGLIIKHWGTIRRKAGEAFDWIWRKIQGFGRALADLFFKFHPIGILINNFGRLRDGVAGKVTGLTDWLAGLPGRILRALGDLRRLLYNAGRDILVGLWNGLVSASSWLYNAILGLIKRIIPEPVQRALGLKSPSKLFAGYGRNLAEGLAIGMHDGQTMVGRAAAGLAGAAAGSGVSMLHRLPARRPTVPAFPGGAGDGRTEIIVRFVSDDADLLQRIRKTVRVKGRGNVQLAFGPGGR